MYFSQLSVVLRRSPTAWQGILFSRRHVANTGQCGLRARQGHTPSAKCPDADDEGQKCLRPIASYSAAMPLYFQRLSSYSGLAIDDEVPSVDASASHHYKF